MASKYQGRVDSLEVLRQTYSDKRRAKLKDNYLIFDKDLRLPLNSPTAWVSPITKKQYDLGSLWLYIEYHLKYIATEYVMKVSELGLQSVTVSDRQEVADYFLGKVKESQCIDQQLKLELATRTQKREQPVAGFEDHPDGNKKVKPEQLPFELQVIEFIYKFERPTSSKTRSLRCPHKSFEGLLKIVQDAPDRGPQVSGERKMRINHILERKKFPMIVVPEHDKAGNLSLANCEKFLVKGEYVEKAELSNKYQRKTEIEVKLKGKRFIFEVTNNPALLTQADWDNVVAVFVQGRANEFQEWAITQPAEIFRRARGYLLRYPSKEDSLGGEWSIKTFTLDRNVRYRDAEIQRAIWADLEAFLYEKI